MRICLWDAVTRKIDVPLVRFRLQAALYVFKKRLLDFFLAYRYYITVSNQKISAQFEKQVSDVCKV